MGMQLSLCSTNINMSTELFASNWDYLVKHVDFATGLCLQNGPHPKPFVQVHVFDIFMFCYRVVKCFPWPVYVGETIIKQPFYSMSYPSSLALFVLFFTYHASMTPIVFWWSSARNCFWWSSRISWRPVAAVTQVTFLARPSSKVTKDSLSFRHRPIFCLTWMLPGSLACLTNLALNPA